MNKSMPNTPKKYEYQPEVTEWESQGRTDEQKWAVRNFLTGAGARMIKRLCQDLLRSKADELVEKLREGADRMVGTETVQYIELPKAQSIVRNHLEQ